MKRENLLYVLFGFLILTSCNETSKKTIDNSTINKTVKKDTIAKISNDGIRDTNTIDQSKQNHKSKIKMNDSPIPIEELKMKVRRGDKDAYLQLHTANLTHLEDHLFWALLMANKYDYNMAYFHVFTCLLSANNCSGWSVDNMDKKTKKMALDYLKMAADKGHTQAKEIIKEYYPELQKK